MSHDLLRLLGWGAQHESLFAPYVDGHERARVSRVDRGECELLTSTGPIRAVVGPALARSTTPPSSAVTVGDWVAVSQLPDGRFNIEAVLPRQAVIRRLSAGGTSSEQVLAANIDYVAIVEPLEPEPDLGRIERLLVLAWASGGVPLVVLTKADLVRQADLLIEEVAAAAPGAQVLAVSAETGAGVESIRDLLRPGLTMALLGPSGAGKSSLANSLVGADVAAVDRVRRDGKGRHTTVRRELVVLPSGGVLIDTPGLRSVGLVADDDALSSAFAEVDDLAVDCRFRDCSHETEPGCAVLAAVDAGELSQQRLERWRKLRREVRWQEIRSDARLRAQVRAEWRRRSLESRRSGRHRPSGR